MGTHLFTHIRRTGALLLTIAVVGALAGVFIATHAHAAAYATNYCVGWEPNGGTCVGPSHTLTANIVYDDTGSHGWVCEIALNSSGGGVGGWTCGYGSAESCYPGNQLLRGEIDNGSGYWLYMNGTEYYAQGCP